MSVYRDISSGVSSPDRAVAVDISTEDYEPGHAFFIRVGGAGNVTYRALASSADVAESYAAGDVVGAGGVYIQIVRSTGTTATGLVAFSWSSDAN